MELVRVLMTIPLVVIVFASLYLAAHFRARYRPALFSATPGGLSERLLYPWRYLRPASRACPVCGQSNPPTAVYCTSALHPPNASNHLVAKGSPGPLLMREGTRVWGIRVLVGLILSAALWLNHPLAIYAVLTATVLWILVPLMICSRAGCGVFLLISAVLAAFVGCACFLTSPTLSSWLASRVTSLPAMVSIGSLHIPMGSGVVTPGALLINGVCVAAALLGVLLSFVSNARRRAPDFDGPIVVAIVGILFSAFFLYVVSTWQGISGLAFLYRLLMAVSFGWLLLAFAGRAIVRALPLVKKRATGNVLPRSTLPNIPRLNAPLRPFIPPRGRSGGLYTLVDQIAHNLEVMGILTVYAVQAAIVGLANVLAGAVTVVLRALWILVDFLLQIVRWIAQFIRAAVVVLVKDLALSLLPLVRLAALGFRVTLYGPALVLAGCFLVAASADAAHLYLGNGHLPLILLACEAWAAGAACFAVGAVLYVDRSLLTAFFDLMREYAANAILLFALYLDVYGLERRVLDAPSHFGIIAWSLNAFLAVIVIVQLLSRRVRQNSPATSSPRGASRLLYSVVTIGLVVLTVYGFIASVGTLPRSFPTASQSAILFSLGGAPESPSAADRPVNYLYAANWSHGMDGWQGSKQWSASGGKLVSTSKVKCCLNPSAYVVLAPVDLKNTPNYAVQANIQITQSGDTKNGCYFGLLVRATAQGTGYAGGISAIDSSHLGEAAYVQRLQAKPNQSPYLGQVPYRLFQGSHTYRIEVADHLIRFFVDAHQLVQVSDTAYSLGGQVGLIDYACGLSVSSFTVSSL